MKKIYCILTLFLLAISITANAEYAYEGKAMSSINRSEKSALADSIMKLVIDKATGYADIVSHYNAEIYVKGHTEILKQNFLIRFANHIFPVDRKNKNMLFEMLSESTFDAPNNYNHDFKAINGNSIPNSEKQQEVMTFLNFNVYSPTVYNENILMPVASNAFKVYKFTLEDVQDTTGLKIYKIRFTPKILSQKLICGDLYIIDNSWIVDKIDMNGQFSFAEFNVVMSFNRGFHRFILPDKADLFLRYNVLGNVIVSTYHSTFKYNEVQWVEENNNKKSQESLDLTSYYQIASDTVPIVTDTTYWNQKRDIPLTHEEKQLYAASKQESVNKIDTMQLTKYIKLTEQLTNTVNLDYHTTRIKYSGILNPLQLGYSDMNGITYKQAFRLSKTFANDKQIRFRPEIGFVFKRKEVFFKVATDWEYKPEKKGILSFAVGNANEGYSSEITNKINEQLKDSLFNFDDLDLQYFRHYYVELRNNFELFNGFQLSTGVSYHRRIPVKSSSIDPGQEVEEMLNKNYHDFLISAGISYTYRQYYRMDGHRKEYIRSNYPTISFEFTRAIPDVWKSIGDYERIEADIHQSISLGLLRKLNYHIGGGYYTKQKSTYFADFQYFTRSNFPDTWDDKIGGVFNLLEGEWYNASDKYLQAHFMYESPFVLFRFLKNRTAAKFVFSERFYLSQLCMPALPSYTELGYGLGNNIFDVGIFFSFRRYEYRSIGFRIAFELFQ